MVESRIQNINLAVANKLLSFEGVFIYQIYIATYSPKMILVGEQPSDNKKEKKQIRQNIRIVITTPSSLEHWKA